MLVYGKKNNLLYELWNLELLELFEKCQQNEVYYAFNFTVGYIYSL